MLTIDILICSFNKGAVKVDQVILPPAEGVRYIISYQYTDERYLEMFPEGLKHRDDVTIFSFVNKTPNKIPVTGCYISITKPHSM